MKKCDWTLRVLSLALSIAALSCGGGEQAANTPMEPDRPGDESPMAKFAPMLGEWNARYTLWPPGGGQPEVFEDTAKMYFVEDGKVFVVDEIAPDNRYRFVGYHAFDAGSGKYVNWTASSSLVLAWSEGEWNDNGETFRTRRLDPRTGQIDPLVGRGVWTIVDRDTNVFKAVRLDADGSEVPFKEERYTRIKR